MLNREEKRIFYNGKSWSQNYNYSQVSFMHRLQTKLETEDITNDNEKSYQEINLQDPDKSRVQENQLQQQEKQQQSNQDQNKKTAPLNIEEQNKCSCLTRLILVLILGCLITIYFFIVERPGSKQILATLIFVTSEPSNITLQTLKTFFRSPIVKKSDIYISTNFSLEFFSNSLQSFPQFRQIKIFQREGQLRVQHVDELINETKSDIILFLTTQQIIHNLNQVPYQKLMRNSSVPQMISNSISISQNESRDMAEQSSQRRFSFEPSFIKRKQYLKIKGGFSSLAGPQCVIQFVRRSCEKAISDFYQSNNQTSQVLSQFKTTAIYQVDNKFESKAKNNQSSSTTLENKKAQTKAQIRKDEKKNEIQQDIQKKINETELGISKADNQQIKDNDYFYVLSNTLIQGKEVINKLNVQPKQLPFCLIIPSFSEELSTIKTSIFSQSYKNYQIIQYQNSTVDNQNNTSNISYEKFVKLIKQRCVRNPIVMFVSHPLQIGSLVYLNSLHQKYMAWVLYIKQNQAIQIVSFLFRIYELIKTNDFNHKNFHFFNKHIIPFETIAMLQICNDFNKKVQKQKIYQNLSKESHFIIKKKQVSTINYQKYQKIIRLSQDMKIQSKLYPLSKKFQRTTKIPKRSNLTMLDMFKAIQRSEEWYLPENHLIQQLQFQQFDRKYNISEYVSVDKQVRFCVTIVSRNNIQNNRYKKVIDSVIGQRYSNYHIVFLDDFSKDGNLQASINYLKQIGFPPNRLNIVKGLRRNFATYNIINAAFNYCAQDDIQLMMDGDDELIGKYAFQVINSAYQQNPDLWIVYSNHKTSYYSFGISKAFRSDQDHLDPVSNKRKAISILAPIRSWRVKLICHIPPINHRLMNGNWLDIVSDDALLLPLVELASANRTRYINQIMYQYNVNYGGSNINRTPQKNKYRKNIYSYLLTLTPLKRLQSLEQATKNQQISNILKGENGTKYIELKI